MKLYKLNKTFENSMYPVEQELIKISQSTKKSFLSVVGNIAAVVFSGIGTSLLFQENGIPMLISYFVSPRVENKPNISYVMWCIGLTIVIFSILFFVGLLLSKKANKENDSIQKKKREKGREELAEAFHKSIINNIVIGISFADKAEEEEYETKTDQMYLFEAVYYFKIAELEIESMELFDTQKNEYNDKLILKIGIKTICSTLTVFKLGLDKVYDHLPDSDEKKLINDIRNLVNTYQGMLNRMQNDSFK